MQACRAQALDTCQCRVLSGCNYRSGQATFCNCSPVLVWALTCSCNARKSKSTIREHVKDLMQRWENEEQNELLRKGTEREGNQSMKLQSKRPRMPSLLLESAERRLVLDCLKLNAYWQVYWDQRVRRRKRWIPVNSVWPTKESKSWPQVQYFQQCSCFPGLQKAPQARRMQLVFIRQPSASGMQPTCPVVVGLTSWIHTPLFVSVEAGRTEQIMPYHALLPHRTLLRALLPLLECLAGGKDQRSRRCRG